MSYLMRGLAANGGIRIVAADTTALVSEAVQRHEARPTAGAALGRTLTGALLLSHVLLKDPRDRVTLRLQGDGPLGGVIAEAGLDGTVRGYAERPSADLPLRQDGKLDVGGAVGPEGTIEVIRSHAPYGDPYQSAVELVSGEVAEDISGFLARSEQIASAVLLGVYYQNGVVSRSGGVLLQALPDAEEGVLARLEANVRAFGPLTEGLRRASLIEAMHELTAGFDLRIMNDEALPVGFACRCSDDKARQVLAYFTPEERRRMIEEDGGAEAVCHWCGQRRWIGAEAIRSLGDGKDEVRCPDCGTLWYRDAGTVMVRDGERCACGRPVALPN
ncbi:MAG: Hsp33 family molecular chaperone HslO [Trueperaceae bacterium]|nr:Hsp33 family molecular chaperone HslO [Trueperaceae bacterium]